MRWPIALVVSISVLSACGEDPAPPPARPAGGPAPAPAAAPGAPKGGQPLVLKPKVERMYRKDFTPSDFQPDPTGDVNRDPFFSYLVSPPTPVGQQTQQTDECADRKVAEKYAYPDMRLMGIVMRGTKNFAMFKDPTGLGQVVYQGDCLAKERARVIEITPSCVRIEIRGVAPPGAPAPPAHEDKRCLHPDDIEIQ
jgi:Tfp pilus assembly protein PilP